jgi:3-dehydroquinate synthase
VARFSSAKNGITLTRRWAAKAIGYDGFLMVRVPISVEPHPYEAIIENGLLARAGMRLREVLPERRRCFVITVAPVRRRWAKNLLSSLASAGWTSHVLEMPDGERFKTLPTVEKLCAQLSQAGADRNSVIAAFGGGVVGDVSGLVASLFMRGLDFVQIPTTVLAQVDASVGGKTGVNLRAGKNLVGTFHQPRAVLIDPQVLATLPEKEFRSGLYEALKCGVIGRPELFQRMEKRMDRMLKRDAVELEWLIAESVRLKAEVVSQDERERGLRLVLNFGHTIGHALEAATDYRGFLHGEAVAWGMIAATHIAGQLGRLDVRSARRIKDTVLALSSLPKVNVRGRSILRLLQGDKKTKEGVVHFILPTAVGKVEVVNDVPPSVILSAVEEIRRVSRNRSARP